MKFIKDIKRALFPDKEIQKLVVTSTLPKAEDFAKFREAGIRRGMWVVLSQSGEVGIAAEIGKNPLNGQDHILFQRTDPISGENLVAEFVPPGLLRQARYNEIPAQRRPLSPEIALRLGYN